MIRSFADKQTAAAFKGIARKGVAAMLVKAARMKLQRIDAAHALDDLKVPPGNRLEALRGDRAGQWSIRVNAQWRLCFVWRDGDAFDVERVDYY